jgi:putative peptidoglycan lipid II flippase
VARSFRSLLKSGAVLSLLTLASRLLGLLREMTKAALLGTSSLSDAFSVAFMIPNLCRRLFAEGSVAVAFIPTFKDYLLNNDEKTAKGKAAICDFLSCMFTFLTFFVSLAVVIGIIFTPWIIPLFGRTDFNETVFLTRLMFPFLAFISIAALFQGILNSMRIFAPSGFAPIVLNLVTILCAYGLSPFMANPARAMATGILIGGLLEAVIQFPFVWRVTRRWRSGGRLFFTTLRRAIQHPGTRQVLRLIGPTIIGMAAYQCNDLVSTALARRAGIGIVSSLQYSLRLQELILGIFAVSIGTVLLPDLAEYAKTRRWELYNNRLIAGISIIGLITIPITFFALAQGEILIRLLFQTRSFNDDSVALTLAAFHCHIPGLFFIALNRILAPAFYAQSDTKSPTTAGIISFVVNMVLAALLVGPFKGAGVALALSLASAVNTALLLIFLRRNKEIAVSRALRSALLYSAKLIVFSIIAILPLLKLTPSLLAFFNSGNRLIAQGIPLVINTVIFAIIGLALLVLTKDRNLMAILRILRKRKTA